MRAGHAAPRRRGLSGEPGDLRPHRPLFGNGPGGRPCSGLHVRQRERERVCVCVCVRVCCMCGSVSVGDLRPHRPLFGNGPGGRPCSGLHVRQRGRECGREEGRESRRESVYEMRCMMYVWVDGGSWLREMAAAPVLEPNLSCHPHLLVFNSSCRSINNSY